MAQNAGTWRRRLRTHLAARLNQPLAFGELAGLFCEMIPLHHATRVWQRKEALASPLRMRRHCLLSELRHYRHVVSEPGRITDRHRFVFPGRNCPQCGTHFLGAAQTVHCSRQCGVRSWRRAAA